MNDETTRDAAPAAKPEASSGFNLSRWALDHRPLTRYLLVVLMLMGLNQWFYIKRIGLKIMIITQKQTNLFIISL